MFLMRLTTHVLFGVWTSTTNTFQALTSAQISESNLYRTCMYDMFYFLSLFTVLFVVRAFSYFVRMCLYHCAVLRC